MSQNNEDLKNALKNYFESSHVTSTVQIRYRSPSVRTACHDARGDVISLAFENMVNRSFPLWAAYILAYEFADLNAERLKSGKVPFTGVYKVIDGNTWHREVFDCFEQYMKELFEGKRELPVMPKRWDKLLVSFSAQKNRKPKMEDRHIILPSLIVVDPAINMEEKSTDSFFAVFDGRYSLKKINLKENFEGHHGAECSAYASAHFVECLFEALLSHEKDMEEALKSAFDLIDKRITLRCKNENIKSGTTASCVYLKNDEVAYLAWCGDSSIGVLRSNMVYTISKSHKPENPEEMRRIEDAGGVVVSINGIPRLNGVLNLSRSLGDICAKPMICSKPDVHTHQITDQDYIMFLSSDGVWDTLDEDEIYATVRSFVTKNSIKDYISLAGFIVDKAKEAGATDNLTLICIFLKSLDEIWTKFALTSLN